MKSLRGIVRGCLVTTLAAVPVMAAAGERSPVDHTTPRLDPAIFDQLHRPVPRVPKAERGETDVDVTLIADDGCTPGLTHSLQYHWALVDPVEDESYTLSLTAVAPDGSSETRQVTATGRVISGVEEFFFDTPLGGTLTGLTDVEARTGHRTLDTSIVGLRPCQEPPVPFPADVGFSPPPGGGEPPILGAPNGDPNETDIVHLGGTPYGATDPIIVAAAGTGSGYKLFSYTIDDDTQDPVFLKEVGPRAGLDVKLRALKPAVSPGLSVAPFVGGVRRDDGNLWLTTWQTFSDGAFMDFDTVGYGANVDARIEAYDIIHRVKTNGDFQVITPVRTNLGDIRVVTWRVDRNTGDLTGVADSGGFGSPSANTQVSIAHLEDDLFVVGFEDTDGKLVSRFWDVSQGGTPSNMGGAASGITHSGGGSASESLDAFIDLPLNDRGFLTPMIKPDDSLELHVWETREVASSWFLPYQITDSTLDQSPNSKGVDVTLPTPTNATDGGGAFLANVRALLTDGLIEEDFGVGDGELFDQIPNGELTAVHLASVTKNMTLLVAVEAIENGEVALNDNVEVSDAAAAVGGSRMDLDGGEIQTLETLLHGMMLRSGNDASAAIAEHISNTVENFVDRMNLRASQLGMSDTFYWDASPIGGSPAGGGTSTPQDQVTLWMFARELPLFAELAKAKTWDACGTGGGGQGIKCYSLTKFGDSGYPGLEGWKGGNGGFYLPGYSDQNGPYCIGSGCLVAQATRLDRDMIVALQSSGNRWGDTDEMFVYGFRQQFTPDRRSANVLLVGLTQDFAIDAVGDTLGVIAIVEDNGDFSVCSHSLSADSGNIDKFGCHEPTFSGVAGSLNRAAPTRVDGVRLSTLLADGDYWIARTSAGGGLTMTLWRVGRNEP